MFAVPVTIQYQSVTQQDATGAPIENSHTKSKPNNIVTNFLETGYGPLSRNGGFLWVLQKNTSEALHDV